MFNGDIFLLKVMVFFFGSYDIEVLWLKEYNIGFGMFRIIKSNWLYRKVEFEFKVES